MNNSDLEKHRIEVAAQVSGIVLEIGFGTGLNLPYYKNVTKLYALEPSDELFNFAQNEIKKVSFAVEHLSVFAENIPLVDNSVDFVVSTWTICSIPQPKIALQEILRVLKPEGKLVFIEHGESPDKVILSLQKILTPASKCLAGGCHMDRNIEKLIIDTGFDVQKIEKFTEKSKPLAYMYKGIAIAKK